MKFNFKKIFTVGAGALMALSTAGFAAAANFPAPFVSNGVANAAIVYGTGTGVSVTDQTASTSIQSYLSELVSDGTVTIDGESVDLASGSTKIWLNTSLNTAKTTLTKSDLPTVLEQTTFSGNVDSKLTSTINIGTNKVTFAKQPSSNDDPVVGIAMGTAVANALYNASITMPAINFTSADSEGETIHLFGKDFVVSTSTDSSDLVLFSSAQQSTLTLGGDTPNPSTSVVINGQSYTVELITGSDTSATVSVNGESKEITEGSSKKVGGIDVAVKSVTSSSAINTVVADLLIGSDKITFTDGSAVLRGADDDPIDGTLVDMTGDPTALTGLTVSVYAPDSSNDAILAGDSFTDPVFGSFSVVFTELSSPINNVDRDMIVIDKAGDKGMSLGITDSDGNEKTFDFAYNATTVFLGDSNSYKILPQEMKNLTENNYTIIGNQDYGHLVQVTRIYNYTGSDYSKDDVQLKDVITGEYYNMDAISEGQGRITVDGRQYTVYYQGSGDTGYTWIKFPTSESTSTQKVILPTIQTEGGALVELYEPQTINLTGLDGLKLPNGDGYSTVSLEFSIKNATSVNWTVSSTEFGTGVMDGGESTLGPQFQIGRLTYALNGSTTVNHTTLYLVNNQTGAIITQPGVAIIESKDDSSNYNAIVIPTEDIAASMGTSTNPLGVGTISYTSPTWYTETLQSDSDITQDVDWWGTLISEDSNTASQKIVTLSYPKEQVYANVAIAESDAVMGGGLGNILVTDAEVSSVSSKNLIVIGGSCINSVAAQLLGSSTPICGPSFTALTQVNTGQALIKSFNSPYTSGKIALLVAGYDAADTTMATTYLTTQVVDTTVGTSLKVTSTTTADTVTE